MRLGRVCFFLATAAGLLAASPPRNVVEMWSPAPDVCAPPATRLTYVATDPRLRLSLHPAAVVATHGAWQPYLFCSAQGTLFCQSQLNAPPFNTKGKMVYHDRIGTRVSRDGGSTWRSWTHEAGHDDVYIEGGAVQRGDGTILMLDTYVVPGTAADHGVGEVWTSRDDLKTLEGPFPADFYLPEIQWTGSTDDGGHPHRAARLHRSIIELPGGDLLTTMYSWFDHDRAPCPYQPTMMKTRTVVVRSRDGGAHWAYLATVAVDGAVGTEGFGEPVLVRIARGAHSGRLLCLMRTGRELYQAHSDDEGAHWSRAQPVHFPGIDLYDTSRWIGLFTHPERPGYVPSDQMFGAEVDPDLVQMRNGVLVCTLGVRTPEKLYTRNWRSPVNGDYLAFSLDGGDTWSEVVQFLSAQPTTQYMGVREVRPGTLFVVYDDSIWKSVGHTMGFHLDVARSQDASSGHEVEPGKSKG